MITERIDFDTKMGLPGSITVTLTLEEALFIAKFCGKISSLTANKIEAGGDEIIESLYKGLASDLFCRYWDGGQEDLYQIPGVDINAAIIEYIKGQSKPVQGVLEGVGAFYGVPVEKVSPELVEGFVRDVETRAKVAATVAIADEIPGEKAGGGE